MKLGGGKEWFSAAELAELALPGLPKTKRKINEDWRPVWALRTSPEGAPLSRPRAGHGGGLEFHLSVLPPAARSALVARGIAVVADVVPAPKIAPSALWTWFDGQSAKTKAEAKRKLSVVQLVKRHEATGMQISQAVFIVAPRAGVGVSTIWEWLGQIEGVTPENWLPSLAPRYSGGGKEAAVDALVWQFIKSDWLRPEAPPFSACYRRAQEFAELNSLPIPGERTLRRKLEREVDGRVIVATREGDTALKRVISQQRRTVKDIHALHSINIDGHVWDVKVIWPDGTIGRPMMVAIQDVFSRKFLAWRIDESENALGTRLVFRDLFETWGIPVKAYMDNGMAFASKVNTGGIRNRYRFKVSETDPLGVLPMLGIDVTFALPAHGQAKPIERAFGDLERSIGTHPKFAGAATGNSPHNKPHNYDDDTGIPIAVFEEWVALGIAEYNRRTGRQTEMGKGKLSFDQVFAASYAVAPIRKATEEHLRQALLVAETRRCDKYCGEIKLGGNRYNDDALYAWRGKQVIVRFDPAELHSKVQVYSTDEKFICSADCIADEGFGSKEAAQRMAKKRRDLRALVREQVRLENLLTPDAMAAALDREQPESPPIAASAVRMVRGRGQTAAALKPVSEAAERPLHTPVIDRLGAALRVIDGGL